METIWYSAKLLYSLSAPSDPHWHRSVESMIVFRAGNFDHARERALKIGEQHAETGTVRGEAGLVAIQMKLCRIVNLDVVGAEIDGAEVWAKVSPAGHAPEIDLVSVPTQTI